MQHGDGKYHQVFSGLCSAPPLNHGGYSVGGVETAQGWEQFIMRSLAGDLEKLPLWHQTLPTG